MHVFVLQEDLKCHTYIEDHVLVPMVRLLENPRSLREFPAETEEREEERRELSDREIEDYVRTGESRDKAGAYGIQEWIGYVGISGLEGSFYNVMGLPTRKLYQCLKGF
jgi:predicted house-cleaning NTP pyrophosphatase (Maf/HAM1 superfamily)